MYINIIILNLKSVLHYSLLYIVHNNINIKYE